jgi:hypothetical protein
VIRSSVGFGRLALADFRRYSIQRAENACLVASDRSSVGAHRELRSAMRGARLGTLGQAIGQTSDLKKAGRVHRIGRGGFSASGVVFVRSKSERTLGAIEAYTEGASIRPVRSRWLWIATDQIPARVGRFRMTPERYRRGGLEQRIGPLVQIPGRHSNEALLIVPDVTVARSGRRGSALRRKSRVVPSREARDHIVAFVGIRGTSRQARIDPRAIIEANAARTPELFNSAMRAR